MKIKYENYHYFDHCLILRRFIAETAVAIYDDDVALDIGLSLRILVQRDTLGRACML